MSYSVTSSMETLSMHLRKGILFHYGVTSVFQHGHLPINHRQIKKLDRGTNFSLSRNLYCSTLNLSATILPFPQIASQRTSKGPISLLTKFSSPMHKARVCREDAEGSSNAKTQSLPSTAVHCAVTVQIPRFIPS